MQTLASLAIKPKNNSNCKQLKQKFLSFIHISHSDQMYTLLKKKKVKPIQQEEFADMKKAYHKTLVCLPSK